MRFDKLVCIDIGFMPREWVSEELTKGGAVMIGQRPVPFIRDFCATWISDPRFPRGLKTLMQVQFSSSYEPRLMRLVNKWGWKIVPLQQPPGQNTFDEIDRFDVSHTISRHSEIIEPE